MRPPALFLPGRAPRRVHRHALLMPLALVLACALAACDLPFGSIGPVGQTTTSGTTTTVKVRILHGSGGSTLIEAPITINGKGPYDFIIDTGASISVVDTTVANELKLPVVGEGQSVSGVGGNETAIPIAVKSWSLGKLKLPSATITKGNLPDAEHGQGLQGLLGSDVLSLFGKVTIDYSGSSFTVYRQAALIPASQRLAALPGHLQRAA